MADRASIEKLVEDGVVYVTANGQIMLTEDSWTRMSTTTAHEPVPPRNHDYSKKEKDGD